MKTVQTYVYFNSLLTKFWSLIKAFFKWILTKKGMKMCKVLQGEKGA